MKELENIPSRSYLTAAELEKKQMLDNLVQLFRRVLRFDDSQQQQMSTEQKLKQVANHIRDAKNVAFMTGAGISTAAGIPDFRTPSLGIYSQIRKYNLNSAEDVFSISQFRKDPFPFFDIVRELFPKQLKPTLSHYFMRMLHDRGQLLRVFTQNVDALERIAGIPAEKVVEAHGSFATAHCTKCDCEFDCLWIIDHIFSERIPTCEKCQGVVKPDVVLFGEAMPDCFHRASKQDMRHVDCLVVMGTSLEVYPFAQLQSRVSSSCPRVAINKTSIIGRMFRLAFSSRRQHLDYELKIECDEACKLLAKELGLHDQLEEVMRFENAKLVGPDVKSTIVSALNQQQQTMNNTSINSSSITSDL